MPVGTCCIHFHIYRSSHPEVFFKKGVLPKIGVHRCSSANTLYICSRTPFSENTSGELPLHIVLNIEVINVEVLFKQVENCLKYISKLQTLFITLYATLA